VDEEPLAVAKRVAVRLLHRRAGSGSHMGQEERGLDLGGQMTEIVIVPGRLRVAIHPGEVSVAIPSHAETVAVGRGLARIGGKALVDQRVLRLEDELFEKQGGSRVRQPSTHGATSSPGIRCQRDSTESS